MTKELKSKLNELKDKLHSRGMRATPQRLAIFEALIKTKKHPAAESIFADIRKTFPATSRATVYSTLKSLQKAGLVQEIGSFGDIRRFDGNLQLHAHLICIGCNKIEDIEHQDDAANLESYITEKKGYQLTTNFLSFSGYCPECKDKITRGI